MEHRIIRLEETVKFEKQRVDYHLAGLNNRLEKLEETPAPLASLSTSGGLKLLLAVGLTLLAFLATGDPKAVTTAARLGLGLP